MRALTVVLLVSSFMAATAGNVSLAGDGSGNEYLPHGRDGGPSSFMHGVCFGIIDTVFFFQQGNTICAPAHVSNEQLHAVVVKYLDNHPEGLHEDIHPPQ